MFEIEALEIYKSCACGFIEHFSLRKFEREKSADVSLRGASGMPGLILFGLSTLRLWQTRLD